MSPTIAVLAALLLPQAAAEKTKTLKAGDFTLKVPETWEVVADAQALLTVRTPKEGEADKFRENLRVEAQHVTAGATSDAEFQGALKEFEGAENPLKVVGNGSILANGHKMPWMSLRPKKPTSAQAGISMVEYNLVHGGKLYRFIAMAADAQTDKFKGEVEKILKAIEPKAGK